MDQPWRPSSARRHFSLEKSMMDDVAKRPAEFSLPYLALVLRAAAVAWKES